MKTHRQRLLRGLQRDLERTNERASGAGNYVEHSVGRSLAEPRRNERTRLEACIEVEHGTDRLHKLQNQNLGGERSASAEVKCFAVPVPPFPRNRPGGKPKKISIGTQPYLPNHSAEPNETHNRDSDTKNMCQYLAEKHATHNYSAPKKTRPTEKHAQRVGIQIFGRGKVRKGQEKPPTDARRKKSTARALERRVAERITYLKARHEDLDTARSLTASSARKPALAVSIGIASPGGGCPQNEYLAKAGRILRRAWCAGWPAAPEGRGRLRVEEKACGARRKNARGAGRGELLASGSRPSPPLPTILGGARRGRWREAVKGVRGIVEGLVVVGEAEPRGGVPCTRGGLEVAEWGARVGAGGCEGCAEVQGLGDGCAGEREDEGTAARARGDEAGERVRSTSRAWTAGEVV
ncbi:hypothetical protein DFH09DRAFT_1112899 [Mycena vulgaris]|nr:hypothetical protein DFH09DRAFT_1112899 [Mycena vulgaris]